MRTVRFIVALCGLFGLLGFSAAAQPYAINILPASVTEGNSGTLNLNFNVLLSSTPTSPVSFDFRTQDGTALAGIDYQAVSTRVTSGTTSNLVQVSVPIIGDLIFEPNETFTAIISNPSSNGFIQTAQAVGTINNNDPQPSISIGSVSLQEGNSGTVPAVFKVSLSNPSFQTITVNFNTTNGSATAGIDFVAANATVTFSPGDTAKTITILVNGDLVTEPNETFFVNLSGPTNATISLGQGTGTGTIVNDDQPPTISINNATVTEGNTGTVNAVFTVSLSNPSSFSVSVNFSTSDGTATAGTDYVAGSATVTFTPGETAKNITINVNGDILDELDETFFVNLNTAVNASIAIGQGQGTGTITDDDGPPSISINNASVTEGDAGTTNATFNITLSAPSGKTISVDYATTDGTASAGSDYVAATGTLTFNPGETSKSVTVAVNGDILNEPDETFFVNLSNLTNATIVNPQGVGTIVNDDPPPSFSINDVTVTEGNAGTTNAAFTVSLSNPSGQTITVDYSTADGSATAGSDYGASSGTLLFNPGETTKNVVVAVNGDNLFEADETFFVNLTNATNAAILNGQAVGTISNDDAVPSISISDVTVTEGNTGTTNAIFTVSLSNPSSQTVSVDLTISDGTATAGSDYVTGAGTLTFNPGETTKNITVLVNGDNLNEPDETFFVNLTNSTNAAILNGQAVGTILNDDTVPSISISDVTVTEGNTGITNANFTVSLSNPTSQTVTVDYATADGTATAGSDYVAGGGTMTFSPGETSKSIVVTVNGDNLNEPDETFFVNLTNATNATIADAQGVGTILNDDAIPSISINDVTVEEGNAGTTNATFTVSLSNASSQTVSVDFTTSDGTATAGSDYVASSGTMTFSPGETAKNITVIVNGDLINEPDETFFVNLSNATNATIADAQGVGTIVNDDSAPSISINDVSVTEGNTGTTNATFTVTLSNASSKTITVDYATTNGTATAGSDYLASSGAVTFSPGETTKNIIVLVNGDPTNESDEILLVNLTNPVNATISDPQGVGTIVNDDAPPILRISDATVTEGNTGTTDATFSVDLTNSLGQVITSGQIIIVNFSTSDGTATAGSDYGANSGTLVFNLGETTKSIVVAVNGDDVYEADETFFVNLTNATNTTIVNGQGVGTIINDDANNHPPVCAATPSISELWPPNHRFVEIQILGVTDPDGDPVTITITKITQDEPVNTVGDGNTTPDGAGVGTSTAQVRAERTGNRQVPGNGRVYRIWFSASDGRGGECTGSVAICVPQNMGSRRICVDDGQQYNSVTGDLESSASLSKSPDALFGESTTVGRVLPKEYALYEAYPNPFNPSTTIQYDIPQGDYVKLKVYDITGREVATLVDEFQEAGHYVMRFNAQGLPSGVYLYHLSTGKFMQAKKLLLTK